MRVEVRLLRHSTGEEKTFFHPWDHVKDVTDDSIIFWWTEGNGSCQCNRLDHFGVKGECGDGDGDVQLVSIKVDGRIIYEEAVLT